MEKWAQRGFVLARRGRVGLARTPDGAGEDLVRACAGGVAAAGLFAALVGALTPMDGFNMSEAENLLLYGAEKGLSIRGLLVCGVLVAALGAVMDVAMSIASAAWELREHNDGLSRRELFRSGMNIGRDAMGTMANTLILAYVGSSLNVILLLMAYNHSLSAVLNREMVAVEVLQSVAGSIGILCAVPCTAAVTCALHKLRLRKRAAAGAKAK